MKKLFTLLSLYIVSNLATVKAQSWVLQLHVQGVEFNEINFIDENTGWAFGDSSLNGIFITGLVMKTTDHGVNWIQQDFGSPDYRVFATSILNSSEIFAAGRNAAGSGNSGIFVKSTDGGNSWTNALVFNERIYGVCFKNSLTGWVMGKDGFLSKTTDGGNTWTQLSFSGEDMMDMKFFDQDNGILACGGGEIYRTTDGGNTWYAVNSGSNEDLTAIAINGNSAWVCGGAGEILYSQNMGQSWMPQTSGTVADFETISFYSQTDGFAAGMLGIMEGTSNGGNSWSSVTSNSAYDITSMDFINSASGWFCTSEGDIFTYSNSSGIPEMHKPVGFIIFPNPAQDLIQLSVDNSKAPFQEVIITDSNGRQLLDFKAMNNESNIDVSGLASGVYTVHVIKENNIEVRKLIKY
jgi:photosystem II stability/assembly factor-like uncharacterized protein